MGSATDQLGMSDAETLSIISTRIQLPPVLSFLRSVV